MTAGAGPAIAIEPPPAAESMRAAELKWGDGVDDAASVVRGLVQQGLPGYTGMSTSQTNLELRVLWKALIPAAVAALNDRQIAGLTIRV